MSSAAVDNADDVVTARCSLPPEPASVGAARRFVLGAVPDLEPATAQALALMVSELATNCVLHANTDFHVQVASTSNSVRVELRDTALGHPEMQSPPNTQEHGRGLRIVAALADQLGATPAPTNSGKTVWFILRRG